METTHYFLELGHCNSTKNKLQHEVYDYFKSINGKLIEKKELTNLKEKIWSEIQKLNNKYPRMKAVEVEFNNYHHKSTIYVKSVEAINFYIHSAELVKPNEMETFKSNY